MAATSNEPVLLLKTAVAHITDYINSGVPPQDALQKVAKELDLAPNFIKRASEAVNVGLTHSHFKKNASARDTDFPITDADAATTSVFGEAVKEAYEKEIADVAVCVDNFKLPIHKLASPKYKQAYEQIVGTTNPEQQMSLRGVSEKSALYIDRLEKSAAEAHYNTVNADMSLKMAFADLVNDFCKEASARQEWHDFESQTYAEHGPIAVPYLDLMYKVAAAGEERGVHNANMVNYTVGKQTKKFAAVIEAAKELSESAEHEKKENEELKKAKDHVADAFQEIGKAKMASMIHSGDLTVLESLVVEKEAAEKHAGEWIEASCKGKPVRYRNVIKAHRIIHDAGGIDKAYATLKSHSLLKHADEDVDPVLKFAEEKEQKVNSTLRHIMTSFDTGRAQHGEVSAQLDNSKRQQLLSELITTDPILKEADPHHVASAYLQMAQSSPELSMQKEVVRGHLRQAAQGQAINPHDVDLLSKANTALLETKEMRDPKFQAAKLHKLMGDKK